MHPALAILAGTIASQGTETAAITGEWVNPSQSLRVLIGPCETGLCGQVLWASDKAQRDAARAGTPQLIGSYVMHGFIPAGPGRWRGMVHVIDKKRTVRATITIDGAEAMTVKGCDLGGIICRSQQWRRAAAPPSTP